MSRIGQDELQPIDDKKSTWRLEHNPRWRDLLRVVGFWEWVGFNVMLVVLVAVLGE